MKTRMLRVCAIAGLAAAVSTQTESGVPAVPSDLGNQAQAVYRTVDGRTFRLHLFSPPPGQDRPCGAIVFFHGWGKNMGPDQFFPHCRYLATRGMVAGSAEYRILRDEAPDYVARTLDNARGAVGWIRRNTETLGVDPNRIAAGGGSGGGWAAAAAAMIDATGEAQEVSTRPDALVLFNPPVQFRRHPGFSLTRFIRRGLPPMIIFHGSEDELIPVDSIRRFCAELAERGNRCELRVFSGKKHSFFNYGLEGNRPYTETMTMADGFLADLGWLEGRPTLESGTVAATEPQE